jgi:hypothetical protein
MEPLQVLQIVQRTVGEVFGNLAGLAAVAGLWVLLVLALLLLAESPGIPLTVAGPLAAAALLLNWLGMLAVAVAWHRHVIRGDRLAPPMAPPQLRVLLYALRGYLLLLPGSLASLPAVALGFALVVVLMSLEGGRFEVWVLPVLVVVFLPAVVLHLLVTARLVLVLPGTAVNDRRMTFRRSWELTRGNTWRLLTATFLLALLVTVGFVMIAAMAAAIGVPLTALDTGVWGVQLWYGEGSVSPAAGFSVVAAADLLSLVVNYIGVALFASLLSVVYLELAESSAAATSPPSFSA